MPEGKRKKWQVQRKRKGRTLARSSIDRRAPSRFEEFWKAYPAGAVPILTSGPRKIQRPGEKRLDPQMIDEVRKFAAAETTHGSTETRSIL
jgi:hypothetical protein